jgi:hypothetical protein
MRSIAILSLPCLLAAAPAQSTVQIQSRKDNSMWSSSGTLSNGSGTHMFAGMDANGAERHSLVSFDVAAGVPAGARVIDVSLRLYCSRWNGTAPLPVQLHRVLADWGEGTSSAGGQEGMGAPAAANDATWLHRFYPGTFWTTPGGDFDPVPSGSADTVYQGNTFRGAGMVADVQAWLDGPASNFGWLLKTAVPNYRDVRRFDTREATIANRPVLTVTYLLPGSGANWGTGCVGSGSQPLALTVLGAPVGGTTLQLDVGNGQPGSLMANFLALDFAGPGLPLYPGCLLFPAGSIAVHNMLVLSPAGSSSTSLPVPPGLGGLFLAAQAAAIDTGLPEQFVLSNAWLGLLQ